MRIFAVLATTFFWLSYSCIAAWAGCPMCTDGDAAVGVSQKHHHASLATGEDHANSTETQGGRKPCSAPGAWHMTMCAACLAMPAHVAEFKTADVSFRMMPDIFAPLNGMTAAPMLPPPRTA